MAEFSPLFAAKQFVEWDPNPQTRTEIEALIHAENFGKLSAILSSRLAFGTAGLRGPMGAGYNHMNDLVIMQTSQGLLRYLEETIGETAKERGIVIGYDHRSMGSLSSLGFARITAAVFLSKGFKVYLLENFVATPLVAYGVRFFDCVAGIMVTASHNPKADNGFKVYWGNGSQIIPPHDAGIARCIESNLSPWQEYDLDAVLTHSRAHDGTQELADSYFRDISRVNRYRILNEASPIKIAYTGDIYMFSPLIFCFVLIWLQQCMELDISGFKGALVRLVCRSLSLCSHKCIQIQIFQLWYFRIPKRKEYVFFLSCSCMFLFFCRPLMKLFALRI